MPIKEGLRTALNAIRETSVQENTVYSKYIDTILPTTDIGTWSAPLLERPELLNEFNQRLIRRIIYTQVNTKLFNNPLRVLEGDRIPLGAIGQEIHINPAKGRTFNVDDFSGLLAKYESDVKVQYHEVNSDVQYPATITRAKLKDAFTSWDNLDNYVTAVTQSLYNGAYIDQYNLTKGLVASAYKTNRAKVEVITDVTTEATAKEFITKARTAFLNMQTPTSDYNAWKQVGGYGRDIITWSDPDDIVFMIRNDYASYIDVNVLADAFNIDKSTLLGKIIYVNNFDIYDNGVKVYDGSNVVAMMADKSWFKIKEQDNQMDEFYNANNRTWNMYLNIVRMYSYSLFSNCLIFATQAPDVDIQTISFGTDETTLVADTTDIFEIEVTPVEATDEVTFTTDDEAEAVIKIEKVDDRHVKVTAVAEGTKNITATSGNVSGSIVVTVE